MKPCLLGLPSIGNPMMGEVLSNYNRQCWYGSNAAAIEALQVAIPEEQAVTYHQASLDLARLLSPAGADSRALAMVHLMGPGDFNSLGTLVLDGNAGQLYWPGMPQEGFPLGLLIDVLPAAKPPPIIRPLSENPSHENLGYFDLDLLDVFASVPLDEQIFTQTIRTLTAPPTALPPMSSWSSSAFVMESEGLPAAYVGLLFGWSYLLVRENQAEGELSDPVIPITHALSQMLRDSSGGELWAALPDHIRTLIDRWQHSFVTRSQEVKRPLKSDLDEVLLEVEGLVRNPQSEWGQKTREWVLHFAPFHLERMPNAEIIFKRFPERLATFALADAYLDTLGYGDSQEGKNLFFAYLTYRMLADQQPSRDDFIKEKAFDIVAGYFKDFLTDQHYFIALLQNSFSLIEYEEKVGSTFEEKQRAQQLSEDLISYLARRKQYPHEAWENSVGSSVRRSFAEGYYLRQTGNAGREQLKDIFRWLKQRLRFLSRLLANNDALIAKFGDRMASDFPEVAFYRKGKDRTVTWEKIEAARQKQLEPSDSKEKPTLMIVGIGTEWSQVERYAQAGYKLILVDERQDVTAFFESKREQIRSLIEKHGTTIEWVQADICSEELAQRFAGKIDCIEYQYVNALYGADTTAIDQLLRPGGLFVEFYPFPFERKALLSKGYKQVMARDNIPALLGTASEQHAYPLGIHFLMLKK